MNDSKSVKAEKHISGVPCIVNLFKKYLTVITVENVKKSIYFTCSKSARYAA